MLEQVKDVQERVGTLVNWIAEMQAIVDNPYSNGLNINKVLKDLQGFAAELTRQVNQLEIDIANVDAPKTANLDSAEQ